MANALLYLDTGSAYGEGRYNRSGRGCKLKTSPTVLSSGYIWKLILEIS